MTEEVLSVSAQAVETSVREAVAARVWDAHVSRQEVLFAEPDELEPEGVEADFCPEPVAPLVPDEAESAPDEPLVPEVAALPELPESAASLAPV
ncbi:hypothetical protein [Kocuria sp.]|uniref:hypothetical protein n=1 Tax=Kocuria sp. TaxID=1871328 RepID=UPI0034CEF217